MKSLRQFLKRSSIGFLILLITTFYPVSGIHVAAEEAPVDNSITTSQEQPAAPAEEKPADPAPITDSTPQQTAPATTQSLAATEAPAKPACPEVRGVKQPTGPGGSTFTFNEDTCLWENPYYTWSPVTKQYTKRTPYDYNYNPTTNSWVKVVPKATVAATPNAAALPATGGAGSQTAIDTNQNNTVGIDLFNSTSVINLINMQVGSGNASVSGNRVGGSAASGDATAMANVINMLQSSAGFDDGTIGLFSADIQGNVYGDLFLDPAGLANLQSSTSTINNDVDINIANDADITNDITLDAASGNATVDGNRVGGDATSGNANAVLNLINMINSSIDSRQSFIGMLNIYGNLEGDIILPPDLLQQVIAANSGAGSSFDANLIENTDVLADLNNSQTINNDVNLAAQSGDATVSDNRVAGSATSGNAQSNLTILNLTGHQVDAANSLLVFVNVLGSWVGLIMDAPAGTTAAALGSDVSRNTTINNDLDLNANNTSTINNNVDITAASGDASVTNNRYAGNAKTGDATASANIANVMNSNFALSDWFGVLFINVFGAWNGSFGVDTAAGGFSTHTAASTSPVGGSGGEDSGTKVFRFVPSDSGRYQVEPVRGDTEVGNQPNATLAAATGVLPTGVSSSSHIRKDVEPTPEQSGNNFIIPAVTVLVGLSLFGIERYLTFRQRRSL